MPIGGKIIEFNTQLDENDGDHPDLVNSDPYGEGWIIKIEIENAAELNDLMDVDTYRELIS